MAKVSPSSRSMVNQHSPGHCCFYEPERGFLYAGDLIYEGCLDASEGHGKRAADEAQAHH